MGLGPMGTGLGPGPGLVADPPQSRRATATPLVNNTGSTLIKHISMMILQIINVIECKFVTVGATMRTSISFLSLCIFHSVGCSQDVTIAKETTEEEGPQKGVRRNTYF